MSCDRGRAGVGAAEQAAFGGTDVEAQVSLDRLRTRAAHVVDGSWWRLAGGPTVSVAPARSTARSSSASNAGAKAPAAGSSERRRPADVAVRLAPGQLDLATLAHELAHALAGVARGHDARFRAAGIDVIAVLAGRDAARALADAYRAMGLTVAARPWPPPVRAVGDGFAIVP